MSSDYKTLTDIPYYREDIRQKDRYINERCRLDIYYPTLAADALLCHAREVLSVGTNKKPLLVSKG
ncbi:MAG: hypothetical protein ABFC30_02175 [Proteiniphilum sp.]